MNLLSIVPMPWRILILVAFAIAWGGFCYLEGVQHESDHRDALELKAERASHQQFLGQLAKGRAAAESLLDWKRKAAFYQSQWKEKLNETQDSQLSMVNGSAVLLSGSFIGLYNDAWGIDGQPAAGDPGQPSYSLAPAGTVGIRSVLENVKLNADLCAEDRKEHDTLVDLIVELRDGKVPGK